MKKAKSQGPPQGIPAHEQPDSKGHSHSRVVDTEPPTHPALSCWEINRKLKKLEERDRRDQAKKPAQIESSSVGNPRAAAILWMVRRLKQYVDEIVSVYEAEIEARRFADSPDLWAALYAVKILPSVCAKIGSLMWNLAHKLWLTGGGGPGERASVEEAQRELSRLRATLESELTKARSCAEDVKAETVTEIAANYLKNNPGVTRAMRWEETNERLLEGDHTQTLCCCSPFSKHATLSL